MIGALVRFPGAVVARADRALPGGRIRGLLAVVSAMLALGGAAGVTVLAVPTVDRMRAEEAGREAVPAVQDLTPKLLNFDYRTIDADIARAKSVTTGEYWAQNALADTLRPAVVAQQATTRTVVQAAGVADTRPDRVVVLVFLNQTTTGKDLSAPRVDSRVARMTAAKVAGQWLLAGFEPL
jgi:Mce-associated membrane protein